MERLEKTHLSEFASTVEISQCKGCHRHRLQFSAQKKKGMSWKEISMLGYTTFCMEPIDVMSGHMVPTRASARHFVPFWTHFVREGENRNRRGYRGLLASHCT